MGFSFSWKSSHLFKQTSSERVIAFLTLVVYFCLQFLHKGLGFLRCLPLVSFSLSFSLSCSECFVLKWNNVWELRRLLKKGERDSYFHTKWWHYKPPTPFFSPTVIWSNCVSEKSWAYSSELWHFKEEEEEVRLFQLLFSETRSRIHSVFVKKFWNFVKGERWWLKMK